VSEASHPRGTALRQRAKPPRLATWAAVPAGAALLIWPALLNGYPILFSDTGGLLAMGFEPSMGWDKPFVYGPLLALLSAHLTLWLPTAAQAALLSYMLWITQALVRPPNPARHVLLCAILAAGTAAPWIASTLMPDVFTPIAILGIAALGLGKQSRAQTVGTAAITAVAIASHLSHLIVASACIAAAALLRRTVPWRPLTSLAAALTFLLVSNAIGHGRPGISPYGSVFALARLIADGPARDYLDHACPAAGYRLCAWRDRLTADSDQFLWDPDSPFWQDPAPLPVFAAEAATIVRETVLTYPARVLAGAVRNAVRQLGRSQLGDTLVADYLTEAVLPRLQRWLPADASSWTRSLQTKGELPMKAARLAPLHVALLAAGAAACALILASALRRPNPLADLTALVLIGLAANALATGALSTVHDRYEARVAWLITLPPLIALSRSPKNAEARAPNPS